MHKEINEIISQNIINYDLYNFLLENNADYETIYLCLFFLNKYPNNMKSNNFTYLNKYFECINEICNLNFDTSLNSYDDYRNLIVILSKNYKTIIAVLYLRLYSMEKLKKIDFEQKVIYATNTLHIYAPLAHRLGIGNIKTSLEEYALYFIDLNAFKMIANKLEAKKEKRDKEVNKTINYIIENIDTNIDYKIFGRSKSIYSIYKKVVDSKKGFEDIYDFQGIRIICSTKEECYTILGIIHKIFQPIPYRFKDYILLKKSNLYQSIHTSVMTESGDIYEIQIRTEDMDEIAERGIAAHWLYKEQKNLTSQNDIEESLHIFRDVITEDSNVLLNEHNDIFKRVIYTYTPHKKLIILPKGASVVDFAYRIHTKIAEHMVNALVNKKIVPFSYILQNGDIVEIQTKANVDAVQKEWLNICITNHSKKKIKGYLNRKKQNISSYNAQEGKKLLENHLKNAKLKYDIINDNKLKESIVKIMSYKNIEKVYSDFYLNKLSLIDINKLELLKEVDQDLILMEKLNKNKETSKKKNYDIIIPGIDNIKIEFAKCCSPIYGDNILGIIKNGKSITVHKKGCKNLSGIKEINLEWDLQNLNKYTAYLLVESTHSPTLINNVVASLSKEKIIIKSANYKVLDKNCKINLEIEVYNTKILNEIINILKNIGENTTVRRL